MTKGQEKNTPSFSFNEKKLPAPLSILRIDNSEFNIDINNLSTFETQAVCREVLDRKSEDLVFSILWKMLLKENDQYRAGYFPRREAKLKGIYAFDTAKEVDFYGRRIRSKEDEEKLGRIVKLSEMYELLREIDEWFSHKKRRATEAENLTLGADTQSELEVSMEELNHAINSLVEVMSTLLSSDTTIAEIDAYQHLLEQQKKIKNGELVRLHAIAKIQEIAEERRSLEGHLLSEIIDLHYNLLHMIIIDPQATEMYRQWIDVINSCLGWSFFESAAVVMAKYHSRIFRTRGRNSDNEYLEITKIVNSSESNDDPEKLDPTKINFPTDKSLKELVQIMDRMRAEKTRVENPYEVSLKMRVDQLYREFRIDHSRYYLYSKISKFFLGIQEKFKIKRSRKFRNKS